MLVEVSGQRFVFPQQCACCGGSANTTLQAAHSKSWGKRVVHTKTWSWNFPYCSACVAHLRSYGYAATIGMLFAVIVVVVGAMIGSGVGWSEEARGYGIMFGLILAIVAGIVGYVRQVRKARGMCSNTCLSVGRAVVYVNWYGSVHSFDIMSRSYAALFMLANAKKLVNLTEDGRRLMQWGAVQATAGPADADIRITISAAASTAATAAPTRNENADDEQLVRCLAKLESLKAQPHDGLLSMQLSKRFVAMR
jgi:hypothetical protein